MTHYTEDEIAELIQQELKSVLSSLSNINTIENLYITINIAKGGGASINLNSVKQKDVETFTTKLPWYRR